MACPATIGVSGMCAMAIGYLSYAGGQANSESLVAAGIVEKLAACLGFTLLYFLGKVHMQSLITQWALDGGIASYTFYLWRQEAEWHARE